MILNFSEVFRNYWKILKLDYEHFKAVVIKNNPQIKNNQYPPELLKLIEIGIELKGSGLSMEIKPERKKMAKVVLQILQEAKS